MELIGCGKIVGVERMVEVNGVELCTEAFGDAGDPPLLLIMGTGASMVWWPDELCRMLAAGGLFVIRYDHRDTGRSAFYEPGRPGYTSDDLVSDAVGVLDAYGIGAAHVAGFSAGGGLAQLVALDFPDRVRSLVLMSTSPAVAGERELPGIADRYARFLGGPAPDWGDPDAMVEYLVAHWRVLTGDERRFDEAAIRARARHDVERARNVASAHNHELLREGDRPRKSLDAIRAPTLVIHGDSDPLFALEHGRVLADEIPNARLVTLPGSGHELNPADYEKIAQAVIAHAA